MRGSSRTLGAAVGEEAQYHPDITELPETEKES
jgi:hypothetical protein